MKRIILFTTVLLVFLLCIVGCDPDGVDEHTHTGGTATCSASAICDECGQSYGEKLTHDFTSATCVTPKTCKVCGATEGEASAHDFKDATCLAPKTCKVCGATEGEASAHDFKDATCSAPKTCKVCGTTEGEALAHDFKDATCTAPKTCKVCGAIEGEALAHDFKDATCTEPKTCKVCGSTDGEPLGHEYKPATCTEPKTCKVCGTTDGASLGHDFKDATCTEPKTCKVCGATTGDAQHKYDAKYSHDEDYHWFECTACGDKKDKAAHTGGEATYTTKATCEVCGVMYGDVLKVEINWNVEALTPTNNEVVCLANSEIMRWYEGYDYNTTNTNSYMTGEDIFYPNALAFKWTVGEAAKYYKVYLSESAIFQGADCYLTSTCELVVDYLHTGERYYWFVDAVYEGYTVRSTVFTFMTQDTPRTVRVDGVSNMRDIGGYVTIDGLRIKQGMIYRSAKLDDITESGKYTLLNILGVKTDLDLRGARTSDGNGGYYSDLKNATHPVGELNHIVSACPWYATGENGIWNDSFNKTEFAKAVKVFADPNNYPIVFHCSLGRDRTGTLAMVLGGLLGLDENTLMMEYELSAFSYWGAYNANYESLLSSIHGTYLYIDQNYDGDTFSEKVADFLMEIGVTAEEIASIRSIMLEEVE